MFLVLFPDIDIFISFIFFAIFMCTNMLRVIPGGGFISNLKAKLLMLGNIFLLVVLQAAMVTKSDGY